MPAVPPRSLGGRLKQITKTVKQKYLRYSIFAIVVLEMISILMLTLDIYSVYVYDTFVQLTCLLFVLQAFYRPFKDRYCLRKRIAYRLLMLYYSFGMFSVIFKVNINEYINVCSLGLLGVSAVLILKSLRNE